MSSSRHPGTPQPTRVPRCQGTTLPVPACTHAMHAGRGPQEAGGLRPRVHDHQWDAAVPRQQAVRAGRLRAERILQRVSTEQVCGWTKLDSHVPTCMHAEEGEGEQIYTLAAQECRCYWGWWWRTGREQGPSAAAATCRLLPCSHLPPAPVQPPAACSPPVPHAQGAHPCHARVGVRHDLPLPAAHQPCTPAPSSQLHAASCHPTWPCMPRFRLPLPPTKQHSPSNATLPRCLHSAPADEYSKGDVFGSGTLKLLDNIPVATQNDLSNYPFDRRVTRVGCGQGKEH